GSEFAEMRVYNALGQLVKTVRDSNEIDVSGLVEGVYLVRITDADGKNYVARVAVKK
ncbi:MAG: T9SS type A sorting domain-containing protein, partial [Prevotella sp.]|nr:T9SS type A sorting domain-containing protein [Prevotella sp.]